jgi:hypothetical protein
MDDKLRLDGNAAAGSLREIFSFEVTTGQYACAGCGRTDRGGDGLRGEGAGHHHPLPKLRQCPFPTRSQPRAALDRPEGHKVPAGRGRRRVKRIGDIRAG